MIAAVSPHLDDAVLGCGALLAAHPGAVVITALAGGPPSWDTVTPWDAACGFAPGEDVIAARRAEDREALHHLGASPLWLDHRDAQYGGPPTLDELRRDLEQTLSTLGPDRLLIPLGLFHSDHLAVAEASIPLVRSLSSVTVHAYEDVPYRGLAGLVPRALSRLAEHGIRAERVSLPVPEEALERKRRAVHCYRSQLRGLSTEGRAGFEDAFRPEGHWRLTA